MQEMISNIDIGGFVLGSALSLIAGIFTAFFSASRTKLKFEKELKYYENELRKSAYRVGKEYEYAVEAYRKIGKSCYEIKRCMESMMATSTVQYETKWGENWTEDDYKSRIAQANNVLESIKIEYFPFIDLDEDYLKSISRIVNLFLKSYNKFIDTGKHDEALYAEILEYKEKYEKVLEDLNYSMKSHIN